MLPSVEKLLSLSPPLLLDEAKRIRRKEKKRITTKKLTKKASQRGNKFCQSAKTQKELKKELHFTANSVTDVVVVLVRSRGYVSMQGEGYTTTLT